MIAQGNYWMSTPRLGVAESTGEKRTPYFYIEGTITHDGQSQPIAEQFTRTIFLYLSDQAYGWTVDKLNGLGFNGSFGAPELSQVETEGGLWVECRQET